MAHEALRKRSVRHGVPRANTRRDRVLVGALKHAAAGKQGECMKPPMDRDAVRRFVAGQQAAARRSLEVMAAEGALASEESFRAAMALCALAPEVVEDDPVWEREVAEARRLWTKLKVPWAAERA